MNLTEAYNPTKMHRTERGIIVGQSGTGKTTLEKVILRPMKSLVILDPKHRFVPEQEHRISTTLETLQKDAKTAIKKPEIALVFRPPIELLEDVKELNRFFLWIFRRENTFLAIDELAAIVKGALTYPFYLRACYQQGRELGIGVLGVTQRPANIPAFCLDCDVYWKFTLKRKEDYERMGSYMGDIVEEPANYPAQKAHANYHSFWFYHEGMEHPTQHYLVL